MALTLDFEHAKLISFNKADILVIEFGDPDLFLTADGIQIKPEDRRIERELMRQLPNDAKPNQESITSSAESQKSAVTYVLIGNLVMSVSL